MRSQIWAFFKKDFLMASSYKLNFILSYLGIFFSVFSFFFIAKLVPSSAVSEYGGDYFSFVLIGIAASNFIGLAQHGFASILREMQSMGTIEILFSSRTKLSTILIGSSIWGYLNSFLNVIIYFIFGIFMFNAHINMNITVLFILLLNTLCFQAIGLIAASMTIIYKKGDPFNWVFGTLSSLLAGTLYPLTVLPQWLQHIAEFLPLTHALRATRFAALKGYSLISLWGDILFLVVFAAIAFPLGLMLFKYALKKARRDGSLMKY
jgi:ABC-2 type transport system permease protein